MANRRFLGAEESWAKEHSKLVVEQNRPGHDKKIAKYIQGCDALVQAIGPVAPRTLSQYCAMMQRGTDAVRKLKFVVPRINGPYMLPWTTRGVTLDLMFASDVPRLEVDGLTTLADFIGSNPDQKDQLAAFRYALTNMGKGPESVKEFLQAIGVTHASPELTSMYACFALDNGVKDEDLDDFDASKWDKCAAALEREWGVAPHLAMVAQAAQHA